MRASRYEIAMYGSMVGVPLLMFMIMLAMYLSSPYAYTLLPALLIVALGAFAVTGAKEIYLHSAYPGSRNRMVKGIEEHSSAHPRSTKGEPVTIAIKRFNAQSREFDRISYRYYATKLTTVLGALIDIKSYQDNTLSMRYNCRMGICGSCSMVVNGKPVLACETNLMNVAEAGNGIVEVSPMLGHPLKKDIAPDLTEFFAKHKSVEPTLYREKAAEKYQVKAAIPQTKDEVDKYLPYSYCIMCGLCLDACPVVNSNPNFVGPQALSQVYRYHKDSRDQKGKRRLFDVDSAEGVWGCEFSGSCSKACPKGVDPAAAIQMLKGSLMQSITEDDKVL